MKKLKILHVFGRMQKGGAEMRTLELMQKMHRDQTPVQFDYCVLSGKSGELDSLITSLGGKIHYLPLNLSFLAKFKHVIHENRYDAIHSHVHLFSGYLLRIANSMAVPVRICHLHTTGDDTPRPLRKKIQNHLMRHWLFKYATDIIGVSQGALTTFLKDAPQFKGDPRCQVIYDAIDPQRFETRANRAQIRRSIGVEECTSLIIHVGRVEPVKNHDRLFRIFAKVLEKAPNAHLLLVGNVEARARKQFEALAVELNICPKLSILGSRSDIPDLLRASDLMILPSLWEGLPGVVLEASAVGLRVISSELPGSLELGNYFPGISCIRLSEPDVFWRDAVIQKLQLHRLQASEAMNTLKNSPFAIEYCLNRLIPLWTKVNSVSK